VEPSEAGIERLIGPFAAHGFTTNLIGFTGIDAPQNGHQTALDRILFNDLSDRFLLGNVGRWQVAPWRARSGCEAVGMVENPPVNVAAMVLETLDLETLEQNLAGKQVCVRCWCRGVMVKYDLRRTTRR